MLPFMRSDLAQLTAYSNHMEDDHQHEIAWVDRLDVNENPYDLPENLKTQLVTTYQTEIANNRYPDGDYHDIKQMIANYVTESANLSNPIYPQQISVGNGSDELIRSILIATCLSGEGSILVAEPTFSMYAILAKTLAVPVRSIERSPTNFAVDVAAAQAAIRSHPDVRVVFMVHPNSPTGNTLTESELDWLRSLPESILVVIDEAYFEFSQSTVVADLAQHPNWMILRTFSKAFRLAAHRVGYAIAHPDLSQALEKVRLPFNLPSFSQAATRIALTDRQHLLQVVPEILHQRQQLAQALARHPALQVWPSQSNFLYLRLKPTVTHDMATDLQTIAIQLKHQGTQIRHTGGGLRITVGTPDENIRTQSRLMALADRWVNVQV